MFNGNIDGLLSKGGRNLVNADGWNATKRQKPIRSWDIDWSNSPYEQQRQDMRWHREIEQQESTFACSHVRMARIFDHCPRVVFGARNVHFTHGEVKAKTCSLFPLGSNCSWLWRSRNFHNILHGRDAIPAPPSEIIRSANRTEDPKFSSTYKILICKGIPPQNMALYGTNVPLF